MFTITAISEFCALSPYFYHTFHRIPICRVLISETSEISPHLLHPPRTPPRRNPEHPLLYRLRPPARRGKPFFRKHFREHLTLRTLCLRAKEHWFAHDACSNSVFMSLMSLTPSRSAAPFSVWTKMAETPAGL